ncbi:MAG: hypothetical protein HY329_06705 [Chloroflexi bacterium]|nr:hypothetical protein [Chloroflexota bacterium]
MDRVQDLSVPSRFTAWAYSPYPDTARDTESAHTRSQRLTTDGQLQLGDTAVVPADGRVLLTRTRLAFTVQTVRVYVENNQVIVEWQLLWSTSPTGEDFPAGTLNVHSWVSAPRGTAGWNQVGSLRLQR